LPRHLKTIKIIAAITSNGRSVSLERLDRIICKITPDYSGEEREATASDAAPEVLPVFALKDEAVQLDDSSSTWFLGGRAIDSYECR